MTPSHLAAAIGGALLLVLLTGATAAYVTQETIKNENKPAARAERVTERVIVHDRAPAQQAQAPACDDKNIVGTVIGGAAGGLAGNQIGDGSGQTAATIAGVVGGAYLGNEYIPTRNVTCR